MLGYDDDDLFVLVKSWRDVIHIDDNIRVLTVLLSSARAKRENYTIDFHAKCKDGSYKHVRLNSLMLYDSYTNQPVCSISYVLPIV